METTNQTAPNAESGAPVRKKPMKIVFKLLLGLALLPVLLTAYIYIGGIEWGDWTIPDEAELRLEKVDVPDEDNACLALMALTNVCTITREWLSDDVCDIDSPLGMSDKEFVGCYGDPSNHDDCEKRAAVRSNPDSPERAAKILSENNEFFAAFGSALSKKGFSFPSLRNPDEPPWCLRLPLYTPFIAYAQLVMMKAQVELERGDVALAFADISDIYAFGRMMSRLSSPSQDSFIEFLIGKLIREFAYRKMCDAIVMGKCTDEMLSGFIKMIDEDDSLAPVNRERALKSGWGKHFLIVDWICEHTCFELLDAYLQSLSSDGHCHSFKEDLLRILWRWPTIRSFACHRREMKYLTAAGLRAALANKVEDLIKKSEFCIHWWTMLTPGGLGRIYVLASIPDLEPFFKHDAFIRSRIRILIAAEQWRKSHGGANPPSLQALVPEYLAAVPADPWDKSGGALKYDASLGVVWTIGKNGDYEYKDGLDDDATAQCAFRIDAKPIN